MNKPRLVVNRCQCTNCGFIIESKYDHDFVYCQCRLIWTDGGSSYIRRGGNLDSIRDLSLYEDDNFEEIRKYLKRGSRGVDGVGELVWVSLCDIDNDYLDNLISYKESHKQIEDVHYNMYVKEREYREIGNE